MRVNKDGKWVRAYDPFIEPGAEPDPLGDKEIEEEEVATHRFKFPDMQNVVGNLPFGLGRKEFASKK